MKVVWQNRDKYVIRFDPGEEVIGHLREMCADERIYGAFFSGIGAVEQVELAYYDLGEREYQSESFAEDLEIVSFCGNISVKGEDIVVHAHGSFADDEYDVIGGHVTRMFVSATCELILEKFDASLKREYEPNIGLNLLD